MGDTYFHQELIRTWTKQLYLEHERICYDRGIDLSPVTIKIESWKNQLGLWDSGAQTIYISAELIEGHCWSRVIQVLKHEMAHQLVSEFMFESDAHGKGFKRACQLLGTEDWASKASIDLKSLSADDDLADASEDQLRILRKAKKLLALAKSANQFEAAEAMNKAHYLYECYHLSSLKHLDKPAYKVAIIKHGKSRTELYQTMIGSLLVKYFFVKVVHSQLFDPKTCKEHKVIEIIGNPRHIELAEYVYWFIYNHVPRLWLEYKENSGKAGVKSRNQFFQGVVTGFGEKLAKTSSQRHQENSHDPAFSDSLELIQCEDRRLCEFMRARYPKLRTEGYRKKSQDRTSYEAGVKKGLSLTIHAGVNERKNSTHLRLN